MEREGWRVGRVGNALQQSLPRPLRALSLPVPNVLHHALIPSSPISPYAVDEVESLEASLSRVGERYEYLQGLRSDIDALCDCLGSKAPVVEEMELHVMRVVAECAEDLGRAWEEEVDMDIALGQRVVRAALGAIAAGVGNSVSVSTSASHAASAEWERAVGEALSGASVPADVDETGRDMNAVRRRQAQEMAKQAQGRWNGSGWQRAQMRHGALGEGAEGGGSVRASHMSAFHRRREEIVRTVPAVFADVADKYASLKVRGRRWVGGGHRL